VCLGGVWGGVVCVCVWGVCVCVCGVCVCVVCGVFVCVCVCVSENEWSWSLIKKLNSTVNTLNMHHFIYK